MRQIALFTVTSIGIACAHIGCEQTDRSDRASRAGNRDSRSARASEPAPGPATLPSAVQKVLTDRSSIERARPATARGGPAKGKRDERLKPFALFEGPLPTCFAFTSEGRLFVCFPRWGKPVNYTVAEVTKDNGQLRAFPSAEANQFVPEDPQKFDPRNHLVSVQSVVVDERDRVWVLDTGSINMGPPIAGGAKMWGFDPRSGRRIKEITFESGGSLKAKSYLNDVRFDLNRGQEGTAYVTDSGEGGIIVVDLASGQSWRKLDGHPSVMADRNLTMVVEGEPLKQRLPGQPEAPVLIHSDGIAISPDAQTLYWTPLAGRAIYGCPTDLLADRNASNEKVAAGVWKVADKVSANDGIICDAEGRIYTTDFEDNSIRRFMPSQRPPAGGGRDDARVAGSRADDQGQVIVQDERLLWPDCVWLHKGKVYVTANQLNRQARFHDGRDLLEPPFAIFEYPLGSR